MHPQSSGCVNSIGNIMKLHEDLTSSGLSDAFKMRTVTTNLKLGKFLGKKVRYKKELLTKEFILRHGTIAKTEVFHIGMVQKDWQGNDTLRGFATSHDDDFGRCINPDDVELI